MKMNKLRNYKKRIERMESLEEDLEKLVKYSWSIEYNDWEEKDNPEDHIFHAFNNIKNYLEGLKIRREENEEDND